MYWTGILVGFFCFLVIGLFHPLIIKGEYYFGTRLWIAFLLSGIALTVLSLFCANVILSSVLGVTAFTCFWSILEIFEQRQRVEKGWFPPGPSHRKTPKQGDHSHEEERPLETDQ